MIRINDNSYNNEIVKASLSSFEVHTNGKKRNGISPFISINVNNEIYVGIELTYSLDMFKEMKNNIKTNINQYVSDITYEDNNGWISLIIEKYNCDITRLKDKEYKIELKVESEEINIDTNIIVEVN